MAPQVSMGEYSYILHMRDGGRKNKNFEVARRKRNKVRKKDRICPHGSQCARVLVTLAGLAWLDPPDHRRHDTAQFLCKLPQPGPAGQHRKMGEERSARL